MAKQMSKFDIMNLMGDAANKRAQMSGQNQVPNDEEDPKNSGMPMAKTSPASVKSKQVAAIKEQGKGKGMMKPPLKKGQSI